MELGRHDVVVVSSKDGEALSGLIVPNANILIIGGAENPWVALVELDGSDVVQVTKEGEGATLLSVIPHTNLVIITTRDEDGLSGVEIDAANGTLMLLVGLEEGTNAIVP